MNTAEISTWTPDGFFVRHTVAGTPQDILQAIRNLQTVGFLPEKPGQRPEQETFTITSVCKRVTVQQKTGKEAVAVGFYNDNTAMQYKIHHVYLDSPEDIAQFEEQSGLRLADMPDLDQDAFPAKNGRNANKFIVPCKRKFEINRWPDGQHDDGKTRYDFEYKHPVTANTNRRQARSQPAATEPSSNSKTVTLVEATYVYAREGKNAHIRFQDIENNAYYLFDFDMLEANGYGDFLKTWKSSGANNTILPPITGVAEQKTKGSKTWWNITLLDRLPNTDNTDIFEGEIPF